LAHHRNAAARCAPQLRLLPRCRQLLLCEPALLLGPQLSSWLLQHFRDADCSASMAERVMQVTCQSEHTRCSSFILSFTLPLRHTAHLAHFCSAAAAQAEHQCWCQQIHGLCVACFGA
jgi:hypothetical protein